MGLFLERFFLEWDLLYPEKATGEELARIRVARHEVVLLLL